MASIEDFVNHRWSDAKEALRNLDADFVEKIESTVRLQALELATPWSFSALERVPARRLGTDWDRLLEACLALTMQKSFLQEAVDGLTADVHRGMPPFEVGRRTYYNFRSWFFHAVALTEHTNTVIKWTTKVYVTTDEEHTKLAKRYRERIRRLITKKINTPRNEYAHGLRSWGKGITEDQLWERFVATGLTPEMFLNEYQYPGAKDQLESGKFEYFTLLTTMVCDNLGLILEELEAEITDL